MNIPDQCLVVIIGPQCADITSFAQKHFKQAEVITSEFCRTLLGEDTCDQSPHDSFEVLKYLVERRLERGLLTVVVAENLLSEARLELVALARRHEMSPVAIVLDDIADTRPFAHEGFEQVLVFAAIGQEESLTIERKPLWFDRNFDTGPFDIIGDVHGCFGELCDLLKVLGYKLADDPGSKGPPGVNGAIPPRGRKAVFLGDLVDRGPDSPAVLALVMRMVAEGHALCIAGNHDVRLMQKLQGRDVSTDYGLAETLLQLEAMPESFRAATIQFIDSLVGYYMLDEGRLVVVHAGIQHQHVGRATARVRDLAINGQPLIDVEEEGERKSCFWATQYRGKPHVVYGHTPVDEAVWVGRTIDIDTCCVFGRQLTALRWPERQLVSVPARKIYALT